MKIFTREDDAFLLRVSLDANEAEIKRSYRKIAKKIHPDLNQKDPKAEEKFRALCAAYERLIEACKNQNFYKHYDSYADIERRTHQYTEENVHAQQEHNQTTTQNIGEYQPYDLILPLDMNLNHRPGIPYAFNGYDETVKLLDWMIIVCVTSLITGFILRFLSRF